MEQLVKNLNLDIIILCDGACESIITGSENHLCTPVEDFMIMLAVALHRSDIANYCLEYNQLQRIYRDL